MNHPNLLRSSNQEVKDASNQNDCPDDCNEKINDFFGETYVMASANDISNVIIPDSIDSYHIANLGPTSSLPSKVVDREKGVDMHGGLNLSSSSCSAEGKINSFGNGDESETSKQDLLSQTPSIHEPSFSENKLQDEVPDQCNSHLSNIKDDKFTRTISNQTNSCSQSSNSILSKAGLHVNTYEGHSSSENFQDVHRCFQCDFISQTEKGLEMHTCEKNPVHVCKLCNFMSYSVEAMWGHLVHHAAKNTSTCILCGAIVKRKTALVKHLMEHRTSENLKCSQCNTICSSPLKLLLHLLNHNENSSFGKVSLLEKDPSNENICFDVTDALVIKVIELRTRGLKFVELSNIINFSEQQSVLEIQLTELSTIASELAEVSSMILSTYKEFKNTRAKGNEEIYDESSNCMNETLDEKAVPSFYVAQPVMLQSRSFSSGTMHKPKNQRKKHKSKLSSKKKKSKYINAKSVRSKKESAKSKKEPAKTNLQSSIDKQEHATKWNKGTDSLIVAGSKDTLIFNDQTTIKQEMQDNPDLGYNLSLLSDINLTHEIYTDDFLKPVSANGIKTYSNSTQLQCTQCNQEFSCIRNLRRHILVHGDVRPYICDLCGRTFRRKESLTKHLLVHTDIRPFPCTVCSYTAKSKEQLKVHSRKHLELDKPFACNLCSYSSCTQWELNAHKQRHKEHFCSQCEFICYSRVDLRRHVLCHTSLTCAVCGYNATDRKKLTRHMHKHNRTQLYCCELCGYSCDTLRKFKYHKLRHENKTPWHCPDCDYKCSSRASYDCHRLKHAGIKPYLCSHCGASFIKSSHLNQHMLIHKDEKAFKCSQCGYRCRTKHNLKEHEMIHTGEKPFACKLCNFSCRRKKLLKIHMMEHEAAEQAASSVTMASLPFIPLPFTVKLSPQHDPSQVI